MISYVDYLRLLPKTELHCHFASTMSAELFIELAAKYGVELPTTDPEELFDFADLVDFLVAFRYAHDVLREPSDFERVAYDGVAAAAVAEGNLRYREYYVNPQYFADRGLSYPDVIDPIIAGLARAERDFGVGFRVVVAINRRAGAAEAVSLVREMIAHPRPEVVGLGQDDLTPENTEDPGRFVEAYALAREHGFLLTAHVGETDHAIPDAVRVAIEELGCDRLDHGYRIVDDPAIVELARERGIGFAATPLSTTICSGRARGERVDRRRDVLPHRYRPRVHRRAAADGRECRRGQADLAERHRRFLLRRRAEGPPACRVPSRIRGAGCRARAGDRVRVGTAPRAEWDAFGRYASKGVSGG